MQIFRFQQHRKSAVGLLNQIIRQAEFLGAHPHHEGVVDLLLLFGEFESGVIDALFAEEDSDARLARHLREISMGIGAAFLVSMDGRTCLLRRRIDEAARWLKQIAVRALPQWIYVNAPEGYAYYALYPETYAEAAADYFRKSRPGAISCVGIRTIGTSLSGVVAAAALATTPSVQLFTVRPRGNPKDREIRLSPRLAAAFRARQSTHFLIVDEGPGESGSSMAATAEALSRLGIPDDQIVFFPSRKAYASSGYSTWVKSRWQRHLTVVSEFEDVMIRKRAFLGPPAQLTDLSAGKWRDRLHSQKEFLPPVQPFYERRKYLRRDPTNDGMALLKFAGLGYYGRRRLQRSEILAEAGFAPRVLGFHQGFIAWELARGLPLKATEAGTELLDWICRYLGFIRSRFPASSVVPFQENLEMMRANIREGLGNRWADRLTSFEEDLMHSAAAYAIDGRMLPHEWIQTAKGLLKTDVEQHFDDDFFPGCQDLAWDVASVIVEFDLDQSGQEYLLSALEARTGDRYLRARLPFYRVAYLAFRLGYATEACKALHPSEDAGKFQLQAQGYRRLLARELLRLPKARARYL